MFGGQRYGDSLVPSGGQRYGDSLVPSGGLRHGDSLVPSGGLHCGENFEVDFREGCMRSVKWNLNCGYQLSICLNEDDLSNLVRTAQRTQSDDRWMVCSETVGTAGGS